MRASVIGATGFAGAELLRLLDGHPQAELAYITSESSTGEDIAAMYPHLRGRIEKQLISMNELEKIAKGSDVIFIALPHGHAMKIGKMLRGSGVKIIDLGGDYRFRDVKVFEKWYKVPHADPEAKAVYGLTELYRKDVAGAELVANPGCYTTCSILALVPLLKAGLIETKGIVVDAKSGTTGAGRGLKLGSLYCSVNENFHAYGVATHRHTPEIEEQLSIAQPVAPPHGKGRRGQIAIVRQHRRHVGRRDLAGLDDGPGICAPVDLLDDLAQLGRGILIRNIIATTHSSRLPA